MRFSRKIAPEIKPRQNFITKKRLREDEIDFDKLRSYRLDRVRKELVKNNLEACILFDPVNVRYALDTVPKDLYQKLAKVDLNKPIEVEDNFYGGVMCVGTFTFGHVKPNALDEFIRITKPGGFICFTINEGIHEEYGFDKKIEQLNKDNKWKEIEFFKSNYIASKDVNAWLGLYEVIK